MQKKHLRAKLDTYVQGIRQGDRAILGRAITLSESQREDDQEAAHELVERLLPYTGAAHRIGVSGAPGVGKSTFINALGQVLIQRGHRLAVLAVDPSSQTSGGSILGDKTRMGELAKHQQAFIRPSPSSGVLGGIARHSRLAMLLCEAAGYDVILIETVGVGQSEIKVAHLVDAFVFLVLPGAGDELQGIKRGIMELADLVVIHKADGEWEKAANKSRVEYARALHLMHPKHSPWIVPVEVCSSFSSSQVEHVWQRIVEHRQAIQKAGLWARRRQEQQVYWLWQTVEEELFAAFRRHPQVAAKQIELESLVRVGSVSPEWAARQLLQIFMKSDEGE